MIKGTNASGGFRATEQTIEEDLADGRVQEESAPLGNGLLDGVDLAEWVWSARWPRQRLTYRFAIDGSTDFSSAEAQVKALANATPAERARLSTTISVKNNDAVDVPPKADKKRDKEKRRESGGGDSKKHKKSKVKA